MYSIVEATPVLWRLHAFAYAFREVKIGETSVNLQYLKNTCHLNYQNVVISYTLYKINDKDRERYNCRYGTLLENGTSSSWVLLRNVFLAPPPGGEL